jgi:hypothetical protein
MGDMISFNPAQLQTIKATVAKDHNPQEFNLFMESCKALGLDPFRKQIFSLIYSNDNAPKSKRANKS